MQTLPKIILGIDPGTQVMGYGLIKITGQKIELLEMGVLKLAKYHDMPKRLLLIFNKVCELLRVHHPTDFAIEAPFYAKNAQVILKLGRAQGVAIAAGMTAGLHVTEYMPKSVKQSITGNGNASKEQVWKMLEHILKFKENPEFLDATDAVAVALCHHYQSNGLGAINSKKGNGWADFIKNNPDKIKI